MNRRTHLYLGILATAVFGLCGCKRLLRPASKDSCALLTDQEIESTMKLKITSHKGDDDSCSWVLGGGAQSGLVALMKSSSGAELVLNATLGKGAPVEGVGDSATWLGGMTPIMVVHTNGDIYRLSVMSAPLMTPDSASTKTTGRRTSQDRPGSDRRAPGRRVRLAQTREWGSGTFEGIHRSPVIVWLVRQYSTSSEGVPVSRRPQHRSVMG